MGALVPAVKSEVNTGSSHALQSGSGDMYTVEGGRGSETTDREFLCPICMQIIKDAFLTSCGHSFCYMCIITHLDNKNDCPSCASSLTTNQLFPNFLLNKVFIYISVQFSSFSGFFVIVNC